MDLSWAYSCLCYSLRWDVRLEVFADLATVRSDGAEREDPDADFKIQKVYCNKKKAQGKNRGRGRAGYQNTKNYGKQNKKRLGFINNKTMEK